MKCLHDIGGSASLVLCDVFDRMVGRTACESCSHFTEGTAEPLPIADPETASPSPAYCVDRGEPLFDEPCSCGSSTRVSVYECRSPARARRSRAFCVPLLTHWDRIEDPIGRASFQCCETCQARQVSAAPSDRQNADDQSEPN